MRLFRMELGGVVGGHWEQALVLAEDEEQLLLAFHLAKMFSIDGEDPVVVTVCDLRSAAADCAERARACGVDVQVIERDTSEYVAVVLNGKVRDVQRVLRRKFSLGSRHVSWDAGTEVTEADADMLKAHGAWHCSTLKVVGTRGGR